MPKKRASKKTAGRRQGPGLKPFAASRPECYLSLGMNAQPIGPSYNDATYTSLAFNDYVLNNSAHIALGTGTNLRLGKHIVLTNLRVRGMLHATGLTTSAQPNSVRIIIGRNTKDSVCGNLSTAAAVAQYVESTEILESPTNTYLGGTISKWATMISPSSDYEILYDRAHLTDSASLIASSYHSSSYSMRQQQSIDLVVPLGIERTYNSAATVDQGSFFVYFVSAATSASSTAFFTGEMRVDFLNAWSFEDLGQKAFNFLRQSYRMIQLARQNPVVDAAFLHLPAMLAGA